MDMGEDMSGMTFNSARKKALKSSGSAFLSVLLTLCMVMQSSPITLAFALDEDGEAVVAVAEQESQNEAAPNPSETLDEAVDVESSDKSVSADAAEAAPAVTPTEDEQPAEKVEPAEGEEPTKAEAPAKTEQPAEATDSQGGTNAVTPDEKVPDADSSDEEAATKTTYTYADGSIKVTATLDDPTAVPDDAELRVKAVAQGNSKYDAYLDALNDSVSENPYNEGNTLLYDVAFVVTEDGETIEVEPAAGSVKVKFEFKKQQLTQDIAAGRAADVEVAHLPEVNGAIEAESLDTIASGSNSITVTTDSFSVFSFSYTVDFTYEGHTYRFPGQGSYALADVLAALGIEGTVDGATLELIDGTAIEGDLYLTQPNGVWHINSDVPFTSTYELSVKSGSNIHVITITDVRESSNLTDFLVNAVITGATQDDQGHYHVEEGKDYGIVLSFAEGAACQFDNDAELTYTIPEGIEIPIAQSGTTEISITYRNRTYKVDASYELGTDGTLKVKFDEADPDYPRLVESTNVSYRFSFRAKFDGSSSVILFSDEVERDVVFDDPEPAQVFTEKTGTFDELTGSFNYTITVKATGDVTNVNVKDAISGNALIFNNDVQVSGNSAVYTDNGGGNGFDYTFASMEEGEVITITYSANVDFDKDEDKDGRISVDQTKNTVTVKPEGGDPHNSEYAREITYKSTRKSDGAEAGVTPTGNKIIEWTIDYNMLSLVAVGGDTIKDTIAASSTEYMKYYGDGIKVEVYDHDGHLVDTRNVGYDELTDHSDSSWTYTIPETDTTPYSYHITYKTVVDMDKINQAGGTVGLSNEGNGSYGGVNVTPTEKVGVIKEVESFTTEEVNWVATLSVPEGGLAQATVTDTLPMITLDDGTTVYRDTYKADSLEITGLLPGESYTVSPDPSADTTGPIVITFFKKDNEQEQTGLQGTPGGHTITVRLTTKVNQDWLQEGYKVGDRVQNHTNTIDLNGESDTATAIFGKPGIKKTCERQPDGSFLYTLLLSGVSDTPVSVEDTFDTSLLELDDSRVGSWDHMKIWGGNQNSQVTGRTDISYSETSNGVILTANSVPMQSDGSYYPYYRICYYLRLKDGVDLNQLAIANGGEHHLINTARWGDHEDVCDYETKYEYLTKELLNEGELGGKNRKAHYRITFNSAKATLNEGEPMTMTDVLSKNLSVDYSSIQITTDPAGMAVPYNLKGGVGPDGQTDGTTVATFTVPDSTKVVITYDADVRGNGEQTIVNTVSVKDRTKISQNKNEYVSDSGGEASIVSFKIVKVDGYDANKKLSGVPFRVFCENSDLDFGEKANHAKEIVLTTDENGEIEFDGAVYDFYFGQRYIVQEVEAPEDYATIDIDYSVTLTNKMDEVNYGEGGKYVYYYNDVMQIKNWPLEGLVIEKRVESDDQYDLERFYDFKVTVLKDDGSVDTDYNESNDDYEFVKGVCEFKLKDKEQKTLWGFPKGTKYKVEEILTNADGKKFKVEVGYDVFDEDGNVTQHKTEEAISHTGELTQDDEVIVFTNTKKEQKYGSLKVKKTVTENGSTTLSNTAKTILKGDYSFTLYTDEACTKPYQVDGAPKTVTVTIPETGAPAESEEVTNLPVGDYWIKETTPANGSTPVAQKIKVTVEADKTGEEAVIAQFTNNLDTGSLEIKKNVTVDGSSTNGSLADGTYSFTVKDSNGKVVAEPTITIDGGQSNTATINGLVPGTYTVSEDTSENPSGVSLVGNNGIEVSVEGGATAKIKTVEFTNNYETPSGGLTVLKKVDSPYGADKNMNFSFTVSLLKDDGSIDTSCNKTFGGMTFVNGKCEFTLHHNQRKSATGIPVGTKYKVEEATDSAFDVNPSTGKIESSVTSEAAVHVFTNTRVVGSLKIRKVVQENGTEPTSSAAKSALAGDYEFKAYTDAACTKPAKDAAGYNIVVTLTVGEDGAPVTSAEIKNLPVGDYWVKETAPNNATRVNGDNPVKVTVEAGKTGEEAVIATITNNYETTKVPVTKAWKNADGSTTWPADIESVTVKLLADGADTHKTVKLSADSPLGEFANLPKYKADGATEIVYTVEEKGVAGFTSKTTGNAAKGFTITNTQDVGSLRVTKTVKGVAANDKEFTVSITDAAGKYLKADGSLSGTEVTHTVSNAKPLEIGNVPLGEYTVTELDEGRAIANYSFVGVTGEGTKEVTKGATTTFDLTNTYSDGGEYEIKATKVIKGAAWPKNDDGTAKEAVFKLTASEGAPMPVTDGAENDEIRITKANVPVSFGTVKLKIDDFEKGDDGKYAKKTFTYTISETSDWNVEGAKYTWEKSDDITVTVTAEVNKDGKVVTNVTYDEASKGNITNTYTSETPDKTSVSVKKVWTRSGKTVAWPSGAKVTVALMADGTKVDECTLTADAPTHTFANLPKTTDDGAKITYTVAEVHVSGVSEKYHTTVSGKATEGFVITNSIRVLPKTGDPTVLALVYSMATAGLCLVALGLRGLRKRSGIKG